MSAPITLDGRVAIVTGAARGQGRAHTLALAEAGAAVVAWDVPAPMESLAYPLATKEDLDETVRLVKDRGGACLGAEVDVRYPDAVGSAMAQAIDELGRIDILVANAGVVTTGPLWDVEDIAWEEMVSTNLTGTFNCLRAVVPHMRERRFGRIVVTSSMGGRMGIPNLAAYNATKWGVIGMAKSLALEVADVGVTVNVVCPTTAATPMVLNERMFRLYGARPPSTIPESPDDLPDEVLNRFRRVNPIPEPWIAPEDVARAVLYLVTDPGVLSGTVLEVSLGSSARIH
jgi:SDR family mycofactocin-dependent oxidoreductase